MKSELVCKAMAILNAHDFYYVMSGRKSSQRIDEAVCCCYQ